jgi:ABC-type nitrate/sulfonate/bicarbonate transport system substrate-binding protein
MKGHYRRPGSSPRPTTHPAIWATAAAIIALAAAACSSTSSTTSPVTSGSAAAAASNGPGGHAPTLTGAGSTFDAPFFAVAFTGYQQQHPGVTIGYSAVGSSAGITAFSAGQVNFGASDVPMTATEQAAAKGGPVTQVPVDGQRWHVGIAYLLPDGDPRARLRQLPWFNSLMVRLVGTDLLTVRVDLRGHPPAGDLASQAAPPTGA